MITILDKFSAVSSDFRPSSTQEFFALRLAQKLHDTGRVSDYVRFTEEYRPELLIRAFKSASTVDRAADGFRLAVHALSGRENEGF